MSQLIAVSGTALEKRFGDIVFVHGLDGDARSTWEIKNLAGSFWPEWLGADLENVGVWSLNYDAASLAWKGSAMPLVDRATNALDLCSAYGIGSRPMLFITHSMGGLLVKQMLRNAKEYNTPAWAPFAANTRGIVFLATPHSGSDGAGWIKAFAPVLRPNVSIDDLQHHAPQLRDLNLWYRNNAPQMEIATRVYYETRKYAGLLIVDQTSADPGMTGVIPIPIDADHVSICKLQSKDNQLYLGILSFARDNLKLSAIKVTGFLSQTEAVSLFESIVGSLEKKRINLEVHLQDGSTFKGRLDAMTSGGPKGYIMTFLTASGQFRHVSFHDLLGVTADQIKPSVAKVTGFLSPTEAVSLFESIVGSLGKR